MSNKDEALELAKQGIEIHSPDMPEYKVCKALIEALEQPKVLPITEEQLKALQNQSHKWNASYPMFVHLVNKHFGIDDGLDWDKE